MRVWKNGMAVSLVKISTVISTVVLLVQCVAVSPDSRIDEVSAPLSWAASREAKAGVDRRWVTKVGGSELGSLVQQAIAANHDMQAAAARVERAAAEARIAGSSRFPGMSLDGDSRRAKQSFIGFPFGGGGVPANISSQFGVALNAAWEVDVWGRARKGQAAAIADAEAQQREYEAARVSLAGQVTKAWLALGEANEQVGLAASGLVSRQVLAEAVRERFDRAIADDGGSAAQVRLTAAEAANGEAILAQRKQERERAIRQLELLLGRYPSGKTAAATRLPAFPAATPAGLPSELLMRRPDIQAAERRFASAGKKREQARLARFPSLRLTGSSGTTTDSLGDFLRSDFGVWSLGGSLSQPLFEGGRLRADEEKFSATEREEAAKLHKIVLESFGEVEQALVAGVFLAERERASKQAAALASEAATRADEEFSAGTGDVLTLIEAKQREIDTASQHLAIRRLRLDNRAELHLALGGDFIIGK